MVEASSSSFACKGAKKGIAACWRGLSAVSWRIVDLQIDLPNGTIVRCKILPCPVKITTLAGFGVCEQRESLAIQLNWWYE